MFFSSIIENLFGEKGSIILWILFTILCYGYYEYRNNGWNWFQEMIWKIYKQWWGNESKLLNKSNISESITSLLNFINKTKISSLKQLIKSKETAIPYDS